MPETERDEVRLPPWAEEVRSAFTSRAASVFLLHGVRDVVRFGDRYHTLPEFVHRAFCGGKTTVMYDIGRGISFPTPEDEKEFGAFLDVRTARGEPGVSMRDSYRPELAIPVLQDFLMSRSRVALIIDFVDKVFPEQENRFMSAEERRLLATVRSLATDPRLARRNSFVLMIAESLADVHEDLYSRGGGTAIIELPLPSESERFEYIEHLLAGGPQSDAPASDNGDLAVTRPVLAQVTNGMTLQQIAAMVRSAHAEHRALGLHEVSRHKREAIEAEIGNLVEFTESPLGLDAVAGVEKQKQLLLDTVRALREGRSGLVPKGILLLGPPGTGKTFIMQCFARDIGIPFVELRNIFSKYVGSTEANLEKLFYYLEALAPVFVFIDEFDQSYGRRVSSDSDSGVSRRVFGMFNNFLSQDRHQGHIIFGAATNRPDLIDQSTLRAGRFDMKIPFLLPDEEAREAIIRVSFRNLNVEFEEGDFSGIAAKTGGYSGADLRELVRIAQRRAFQEGHEQVLLEDLSFAVDDYIPPGISRADDIRMMELMAVAYTTSRSLLPEHYVKALEAGRVHEDMRELEYRLGW
ncbi:MAG: ATP-binding protein [candidate division WS1 bacterium]|nr:ATP-binding protein [candidate division WS1 bacterium]